MEVHQVTSYKTSQRQRRCFVACGSGTSRTRTGRPQPGGSVPSGSHVWSPVFTAHARGLGFIWKQMKHRLAKMPIHCTLSDVFPYPRFHQPGRCEQLGHTDHRLHIKDLDHPLAAGCSIGIKKPCLLYVSGRDMDQTKTSKFMLNTSVSKMISVILGWSPPTDIYSSASFKFWF